MAIIRAIEADAPPPGQTGGGSLEDLLRSVLGGGEQRGQRPGGGQAGPGGGGLEDLLRNVLGGGQQTGPAPDGGAQRGPGGGNLQDMLRDLLGGGQGGMNRMVGEGGQGGPGGALDVSEAGAGAGDIGRA